MKLRLLLPTLVIGAAAAAAVSACGSSNQANTVATTPTPPTTPATTETATQTLAPAPTHTATTTTTSPPATRTSTAPAFVPTQPSPSGQVTAAIAVVNRAGYTVPQPSTYNPTQTLQVLIGTRGSGPARAQQAFFFINGRYIGTDSRSPSGALSVVAQNDTAVTLRYGLYRAGDQAPSGSSDVQFVLNNGHLTPLGTIPPVSGASDSRR
jgi:LppP/LprE lipoprotein